MRHFRAPFSPEGGALSSLGAETAVHMELGAEAALPRSFERLSGMSFSSFSAASTSARMCAVQSSQKTSSASSPQHWHRCSSYAMPQIYPKRPAATRLLARQICKGTRHIWLGYLRRCNFSSGRPLSPNKRRADWGTPHAESPQTRVGGLSLGFDDGFLGEFTGGNFARGLRIGELDVLLQVRGGDPP